MSYEDLEDRISTLKEEIKGKLSWGELILYVFCGLIGIKVIDYVWALL